MKKLLVTVLLKLLKFLGHTEIREEDKVRDISFPSHYKQPDNLQDIWFRAVVIVNELNRNAMGYEPKGWQREQLVTRLAQEYKWLTSDDLTRIVNGVLL